MRGKVSSVPPPLQERLDSLEQTVADLAREVRELRAVVDRLEAAAVAKPSPIQDSTSVARATSAVATPASEPPVARPTPVFARPDSIAALLPRKIDFESLIGRYGTLALASLTILLGAGAFLSWAIANGKIGPELRVVLGAIGAGAVGVVGWRLRAKGSTRFGSTLLALSLALVHVDAWGAGPYLLLVPPFVALGIAAAASVAVAVLAWVSDEEALFSVGVGGALIAPFVTSRQAGSVFLLLLYGSVVLATGFAALRGRAWRAAIVVVTFGCWLYTGAAASMTPNAASVLAHDYPALFAIAIAWSAIVLTQGPWGGRIARSALAALVAVLIAEVMQRTPGPDLVMLAVVGTLSAYAAVHVAGVKPGDVTRQPLYTAAVLPLALGFIALAAVETHTSRALLAFGWTAAAVAAAYLQPAVRPTHLMVAGISSGVGLLFALEKKAVASCVALAAHAAGLSVLLRRERTRLLGVPIVLGLLVLTIWTFIQLGERPIYGYTPFLTRQSVAALAMAAAWLTVSWNAARVELTDGKYGMLETRTIVRLAGAVITFAWGHAELSRSFSADISTFLLVFYYAIVGVASIFIGRARGIRVLRHVGLALAIFAALKAIAEASSLAIGLRVGSYLLAGLFLLAVAYWYRDREPGTVPNESAEMP